MIVIALISLFFWTGLQISDAIKDELLYFAKDLAQLSSDEKLETIRPDTYYHLYLFVIPIGETLRNSGLFYEPGRFAVFLGIALALNLFRRKSKLFDIEDLIYIFAIVTTFSTAGYYALLILISTRVFLTYKSPLHLLIGIIAVPVLIWYVNGLDFMWEKVNSDYSNFESYSRFSAIAYHLELIAQSPILGWGYNIEDIELSPNGLTILVLRWGFVFSILYFVLLYKGVNTLLGSFRDQKWTRNLVFVTIIILTFSQTATVDAFYFALMFFGLSKFKLNASNG
ncbi:MAG: hypothetical protein KGZ82_13165 [Bacteroidales bacterium]|nr:hypothetical protein [Bacteroidales bacterium]